MQKKFDSDKVFKGLLQKLAGQASAFVCVFLLAGAAHAAQEQAPPVRAILKPQQITFYYQSFTSFYSCDALRDKVKKLLLALGAAKDAKVRVSGCGASTIPRTSPLVTITLTSPVEVTPQAIAELEKTRSQRELTARVRGERALGTDSADQFDAQWKPVSLSRGSLGLEPGDCELVDELRRKVLPKLAVRIVSDSVQCTPNQITRNQPRLEVEALVQPPPPDDRVQAPSEGASESNPKTAPEAQQALEGTDP